MKFTVIASTLAIATLLIPATALPWGKQGHSIVGDIAAQHLNPEVAGKVKELLGGETLADVAAWADDVRRERSETGPFHYVNIDDSITTLTAAVLEQPQGNVYMAVVGYAGVVSNTNATFTERSEALKFLTHFIGDLHQPLHCGYAHDRGGNTVEGTFMGQSTNLHRLWDSGILDQSYSGQEYKTVAQTLLTKYPAEQLTAWSTDYDLKNWIFESKQLLKSDFYPENPAGPFTFGEEYQTRHAATVDLRLVEAGMRLAATLNLILAEDPKFPFEPLTTPLPIANPGSTSIMPPLYGTEAK